MNSSRRREVFRIDAASRTGARRDAGTKSLTAIGRDGRDCAVSSCMTREMRRTQKAFRPALLCAAVVIALHSGASPMSGATTVSRSDPFEFFAPWIIVSSEERASLDRNRVLVRTLTGQKKQLGVFVATRLDAEPDALIAWTRSVVELKRSTFVLAVGRFSDLPRLSDLNDLTLDDRDLDAIRRCRPGACALKLSAAEIAALNVVVVRDGAAWREGVQQEFRRLLVERVNRYRTLGLDEAPVPADRAGAGSIHPLRAFSAIVEASPYLRRMPDLATWLMRYPRVDTGVESFFYWSKEHYGEGKPVISVTHVGIVRSSADPQLTTVLVAGKQIFATHYIEGGLGLTMIVRDARTGTAYLAYVNRSQVDFLRGWFGGFMRGILDDRIEREAPQVIRDLRTRLESGMPFEP